MSVLMSWLFSIRRVCEVVLGELQQREDGQEDSYVNTETIGAAS